MKKTCLVTGGAGFIGSHLSESLLKQEMKVIVADNLLTGSLANLKPLNGDLEFLNQDVSQPFKIKTHLDYIFHFASPASPVDYQNHPLETMLVNSIGTKNCLDLAQEHQAKILFASTSEVYGDPLVHPQIETYWGNVNPNGPRSCYDEAKRFGEAVMKVYEKKFGVETRIIRIFNTYGPRMQKDDGRVISNFVNQALEGKDITVAGDGSQTRSFCYVADLIEGINRIMFNEQAANHIFNLGNPEEYPIIEIAKIIKEMVGGNSTIRFIPLPQDDPKKRKPEISKIKNLTGWQPAFSLKAGLEKTIAYFKSI